MHDDLVQLYQKKLEQTSNKKVRPREIQERDFVHKKYYLSNQTPGACGCLTMKTHVQWLLWLQMLTNPHVGAVKKYFVKIYKNHSNQKKLDKSQTWKGDSGKNERLGGLKPKRAVQAKIRDMNKK